MLDYSYGILTFLCKQMIWPRETSMHDKIKLSYWLLPDSTAVSIK